MVRWGGRKINGGLKYFLLGPTRMFSPNWVGMNCFLIDKNVHVHIPLFIYFFCSSPWAVSNLPSFFLSFLFFIFYFLLGSNLPSCLFLLSFFFFFFFSFYFLGPRCGNCFFFKTWFLFWDMIFIYFNKFGWLLFFCGYLSLFCFN